MTTTTGMTNSTNQADTTGSNRSGIGTWLVFAAILVAVFFTARALTTDTAVAPATSAVPAVVQTDIDAPQ